ncbi:hypothetical protein MKW94_002637 [Papaver nudicaule]|uniref:Meg domain-containing protein n=1 Tax=Papaver nudicaule TaxID=74823 RepID=A0AA41VXV2_PAPNU|nr:hypothetical protein [Papaver nudicaule]
MGSSSMKLVVALILSLLLLGAFSAEAAGRINGGEAAAALAAIMPEKTQVTCVHPNEKCPSAAKDCNSCCISLGWVPLGAGRIFDLCCCVSNI